MLSQKMKRLILQSDPARHLVIVVLLDSSKETGKLSKIADPLARNRALDQAIWKLKQPVIDAIEHYSDIGLRVVNDIEGSATLVAAGPARAWKRLMDERSSLVSDPRLELVANEPVWHIA
ncbi:hypothetical protein D9M69_131430 [compost metagenome]